MELAGLWSLLNGSIRAQAVSLPMNPVVTTEEVISVIDSCNCFVSRF